MRIKLRKRTKNKNGVGAEGLKKLTSSYQRPRREKCKVEEIKRKSWLR